MGAMVPQNMTESGLTLSLGLTGVEPGSLYLHDGSGALSVV